MGLVSEGGNKAYSGGHPRRGGPFGDMDFKVAGTEDGITGFQVDIEDLGH